MFNDFIWQNYLDAGGRDLVALFEEGLAGRTGGDFAARLQDLAANWCPDGRAGAELARDLEALAADLTDPEAAFPIGVLPFIENVGRSYTFQDIMDDLWQGLTDYDDLEEGEAFGEFSAGLAYYTTFLAVSFPGFCLPWYFKYSYAFFEALAEAFDIELFDLPEREDYHGRVWYYAALCQSLYVFRQDQGLSMAELCAFLYDFAPRYLGGCQALLAPNLPQAQAGWLGALGDPAFDPEAQGGVRFCTGTRGLRTGDLVLGRGPEGEADKAWRCLTGSFIDPFFAFYYEVYIGQARDIEPIAYRDLDHADSAWARPLAPDLCARLLPAWDYDASAPEGQRTGRQVEASRLLPLLEDLGYDRADLAWGRLVAGEEGRVFLPCLMVGPRQEADLVALCRRSLAGDRLERARSQAADLARLADAAYALVAGREGFALVSQDSDYNEILLRYSWQDLEDNDRFFILARHIGKGYVARD